MEAKSVWISGNSGEHPYDNPALYGYQNFSIHCIPNELFVWLASDLFTSCQTIPKPYSDEIEKNATDKFIYDQTNRGRDLYPTHKYGQNKIKADIVLAAVVFSVNNHHAVTYRFNKGEAWILIKALDQYLKWLTDYSKEYRGTDYKEQLAEFEKIWLNLKPKFISLWIND